MTAPGWIAVGLLSALSAPPALHAQQDDVTFFVIGKHASFEQDAAGGLRSVDFSFFSEIFLTEGGDASDAVLTLPTGAEIPYSDQRQADGGARDNLLLVTGKARYARFEDLQADYPDGEYRVSFRSPGGPIEAARLVFTGNALPKPPRIEIRQQGELVCSQVDPAMDLRVRWSPFAEGGADPGGLLDDLVFVILTAEDGTRVAHSGRPFEGRPYLTFAAEEFVIPAGRMARGGRYELSVEHAILDDTRKYAGIPAMTTRAVTTRLPLTALADSADAGADCAGR